MSEQSGKIDLQINSHLVDIEEEITRINNLLSGEDEPSVSQPSDLCGYFSKLMGNEVSISTADTTDAELAEENEPYLTSHAVFDLFDYYWSIEKALTEEQKVEAQTRIFAQAKQYLPDVEEVLDIWKELSENV